MKVDFSSEDWLAFKVYAKRYYEACFEILSAMTTGDPRNTDLFIKLLEKLPSIKELYEDFSQGI